VASDTATLTNAGCTSCGPRLPEATILAEDVAPDPERGPPNAPEPRSPFLPLVRGRRYQGGVTHSTSDEWSYRAVEDPTSNYDLHATVLHLLGIDHTRLTFKHNGIERRLTDVHGHVLKPILA
jgi:hypothetical protein